MSHNWSFKHAPLGKLFTRFAEGLATFSTEPLTRQETIDLTPQMQSTSHRRRIAQFAYHDRLEADMVNIHLASHQAASARFEQLALALQHVAVRGASRCVIAGDFNASNEPALYVALAKAGFVDMWGPESMSDSGEEPEELVQNDGLFQTHSSGNGFTNPSGSTHSRLDRIFAKGFTKGSIQIPQDGPEWKKRSDHLPVFAQLLPD